ncbi:MAG TPA: hypothetical protein VGQ30_09410 [Gemmatimonadaceae bacterium]|jgi:hypothetical protein|nr:hypothetical protein [Gemmatimonadaceae bacterium]
MPQSRSVPPDRLKLRQILIWGTLLALLATGVVLWFRYNDRIVPMLDSLNN